MDISPATVLSPGAVDAPASPARLLLRGGFVVATCVGVGLAVALLILKVAGWQILTVLTGSMRPMIEPGQAVVVSPLRASAIRPGQVITFRRPQATGTVTHRVRRVSPLPDGRLNVTTKGDANPVGETWQIAADGRVGELRTALPAVGGSIGSVVTGPRRPYLVGGTVVIGLALVLFWIWAPEPRRFRHASENPAGLPPQASR